MYDGVEKKKERKEGKVREKGRYHVRARCKPRLHVAHRAPSASKHVRPASSAKHATGQCKVQSPCVSSNARERSRTPVSCAVLGEGLVVFPAC